MVVRDAVHRIQATQANDLARWNCAGKCGSCSAEINGMPRPVHDALERTADGKAITTN
jgi:succinate dehydrogenase/fumarate reductase-like Fe-S protein